MWFVVALRRAGKLTESFTRATELLKLDPNDIGALMLVVALGPTLQSVTDNQIATVNESAIKLLSVKPLPDDAGCKHGTEHRFIIARRLQHSTSPRIYP